MDDEKPDLKVVPIGSKKEEPESEEVAVALATQKAVWGSYIALNELCKLRSVVLASYKDSLVGCGFTREEAMKIIVEHGFPGFGAG